MSHDTPLLPPNPSSSLRRNIELKSRCNSLARAKVIAESLDCILLAEQHQRDTYFRASSGRLKLREIDHSAAQLIWYDRPDQPSAKASSYQIVPAEHPELLKAVLQRAWGLRTVVEKRRIIYLYRNVRIHLDEVSGLGTFIEFEAVVDDHTTDEDCQQLLGELQERFGIRPSDLSPGSYVDLVAVHPGP